MNAFYVNQPIPSNLFDIQYLAGDQPTTCPVCGNRTDCLLDIHWTKDKIQIHECLTKNCNLFVVVADDDSL